MTTVTLTSAELSLTKADLVTINGGSGVTITRSGATEFRILNVAANTKEDLLGLTPSKGNATGGGAASFGSGVLVNTGATVTLSILLQQRDHRNKHRNLRNLLQG